MGVIAYSQEITSVVAPSRLFKAMILDSHNVLPMIVPKSVEFIERDGGVGSIKKTNFSESSYIKYTKHKIDALDVGSFYCKYTMMESDIKFDKSVEFIKGDGGVGSIKHTNFGERIYVIGAHMKYTKHKIDVLNAENFYYKHFVLRYMYELY